MGVVFNPTGHLDISTDPADLPAESDGKKIISGAMTRCKNLTLDRQGIAVTRHGSRRLNSTAMAQAANWITELNGVRYAFTPNHIYRNEALYSSGYAGGQWTVAHANVWNSEEEEIFATNGTNFIRIQRDGGIYKWGISAPDKAPVCSKNVIYVTTQPWEADNVAAGSTTSPLSEYTQAEHYPTIEPSVLTGNAPLEPAFTDTHTQTHQWEQYIINGAEYAMDEPVADGARATYQFEVIGDAFSATRSENTKKFRVCYTYCRYRGGKLQAESNPSPVREINAGNRIYVAWVASPDPQVTHVRFYRSLPDLGPMYFDSERPVGQLTASLYKTDQELGTEVESGHAPPPSGATIVCGPSFNGVMFLAKGNRLHFAKPQQPEYWPTDYWIEVSPKRKPIVAMEFLDGQLRVGADDEIYMIQGTGASSYFPLTMATTTGTKALKCFKAMKGKGIFHLGYDGVYQATGSDDVNVTKSRFDQIFSGDIVDGIANLDKSRIAYCWMLFNLNKLYFAYPGSGKSYPDNFLISDLITGRTTYHNYGTQFVAACWDQYYERLLATDADGYVWELEVLGETTDNATAISWEIESKAFGDLRAYFPRYARYDVQLVNPASTASGKVLLDGQVQQTHSITSSRDTRKRLIEVDNGSRMSGRITGTGPVEIYGFELE